MAAAACAVRKAIVFFTLVCTMEQVRYAKEADGPHAVLSWLVRVVPTLLMLLLQAVLDDVKWMLLVA